MLKGKSALVTGSTSGIGRAMAEGLARQGANVVLNGFGDKDEIEALRAGLARDAGVEVLYDGADMSKPAEIEAMMDRAADKLGGVDILINNAGIQHVSAIEDFPDDRWDAIIAINLTAAFHTTKKALPGMRKAGWGRVLNIASAHGLVASAQKSAYVAAKHGIVGLTKVTALETAGAGITANAICPGWVLTPLVQQQIDARAEREGISVADAEKGLLGEKQPSLQFTTPEQLAGIALFLCSSAADNVTGTTLTADGGWTAQ